MISKKMTKLKIAVVLITLFLPGFLAAQNMGDVNNNGGVDIIDALQTAQFYVGLNPPNFTASVADVDGNGHINIVDALMIAQFYVGLITQFPGRVATAPPTPTPSPTPNTGNLVVNGTFESGQLAPWTIWNESRLGTWKAQSGNYCAAVGPNSPASVEQRLTLQPNSIYELSGYLYVDNAGDQVRLGVKDYGGSELSQTVTTKNWVYRSMRFTTAEYTTSGKIYIYKVSGTGWGYGDNIRVQRVGSSSGGPQPPASGGNWRLVFQDEFNGSSLDRSKWSTGYPWSRYHNHRGYTDPGNVSVENGLLRLRADNRRHPDAPDGIWRDDFGWLSMDYTTGCVSTSGKYHFNHGYMEARLKMPASKGFWPAFWTLGDGWPPEIDIMEFLSSVPNRIFTNYHWGKPQYGSYFREHFNGDFSKEFHVFAVEWDSSHMVWYLDGSEIARHTNSNCSQAVNQYILLNLGIGGWEKDPDSSTIWPGYYDIDWVRVWQK